MNGGVRGGGSMKKKWEWRRENMGGRDFNDLINLLIGYKNLFGRCAVPTLTNFYQLKY